MHPSKFLEIFRDTIAEVADLAQTKSGEYAPAAEADRLGNFKEAGRRQKVIPEKVLMIYLDKHFAALSNYVSDLVDGTTRPYSEAIDGRIDDLILYAILLKCLLFERHEMAGAVQDEPDRSLQWPDDDEDDVR